MASVEFNGNFYRVITMSMGALAFGDPEVERIYLAAEAADPELGAAACLAIRRGRVVSHDEFMDIFKSGLVQKVMKEREKFEMSKYGYRSRKELLLTMRSCDVNIIGGKIEVQPLHADSLDGRSANTKSGPFAVIVSADVDDSVLGAAIREGLSRCTSKYW